MKDQNKSFAYPIFAGAMAGCSVVYHSPVLSLFCLVPLLLLLFQNGSLSFNQGLRFSFTIAVFLFYWMIEGAGRFTGKTVVYGLGAFLLSSLFFSVYWGLAVWGWGRFYNVVNRHNSLLTGVLLSSAWVLAEEVFFLLIGDLPWFGFRVGYGLSTNGLAIQYASLGSAGLISFLAVVLNYFLAKTIEDPKPRQAWQPLVAAGIFALGGWFLLKAFSPAAQTNNSVKAVIATQNISPEKKWNEATGNALAKELIDLSKTAATHQPQIIFWPESILPWTYQPDDDLTKELLKQAPGTSQLIGMNTEANNNTVFNSAYFFRANNHQPVVYHKQEPLAFLEKPFLGVMLPFLSGGGFTVLENKNSPVIETGFGPAGLLICNESAIPALGRAAALDGAQFLVNSSNDGWFANSYLALAHWQHARLRAVETRKDVVVSSNRGFSGVIKASGESERAMQAEEPTVIPVQITPNNSSTLWVRMPFLFQGLFACLVIFSYAYFFFWQRQLQKRMESI